MVVKKRLITLVFIAVTLMLLCIELPQVSQVHAAIFADPAVTAKLRTADGQRYLCWNSCQGGEFIRSDIGYRRVYGGRDTYNGGLLVSGDTTGYYPTHIYLYRVLKNSLIGVSRSGYFAFDDTKKVMYITKDYPRWRAKLQAMKIPMGTILLPGPIRRSYHKRGWLRYQEKIGQDLWP